MPTIVIVKQNPSRVAKFSALLVKPNIQTAIFLSFLILIAVLLSAYFFSGQSLRLDESQSLWQSSHSFKRILNILGGDVHVPLYGLLLHFWELLFGESVVWGRVLSLIFFAATIPATYALAELAYNRSVGLFAAALVAISPFLNWYGNEIRMYSLLTLVTVINQYYFIKIFKTGPPKTAQRKRGYYWLWYVASALIGTYTHYFFWLGLLTQAVFYFIYHKSFPRKTFRNLCLTFLFLSTAVTPWLYYVAKLGAVGNSLPVLIKPTTVNLFNTFSQFLFGFQNDHLNTIIVSLWPLTVLLGFVSLRKNKNKKPETTFFFLAAVLPIVIAFLFSILYQPVFLSRYLILSAPALYIFLSWFFSQYSNAAGTIVKTGLATTMGLTLLHQAVSASTPVKENYQEASQYISQHADSQDIVALSAPFTIYPFEYYYNGKASLITLPMWNQVKAGAIPKFSYDKLISEVGQLKDGHQEVWLLLSYDQGYQNDILQYFETHFQRLEQKNFSPGMSLYVYKLRYSNISVGDQINSQTTVP